MGNFVWNLGAFIVALGILVAVHEWGHFYVARKCGVFVKRFSVGFGKPIWRKISKSGTEYIIAAIPLGGYVSMLDGRIDDVPSHQLDQTFDNKSVAKRMAIIAAGPGINFVFAAFVLYIMYLIGVQTVRPVIGEVIPESVVAQAGIHSGEQIVAVNGNKTIDWSAVNLELVSAIGDRSLSLQTDRKTYSLNIENWNFNPETDSSLETLGLVAYRPEVHNEIAQIAKDSPAQAAGIDKGDVLIALNDDKIARWNDWVKELSKHPGEKVSIVVNRNGVDTPISVTLGSVEGAQGNRGYLGVVPVVDPWPADMVFMNQYGVFSASKEAVKRTWRLMTLSVQMIGKLITGDVSVKNLNGPISIAQGAGASADIGLVYFLGFLALISVSLGVMNLLPLPMLDGGHLMYFLIEWVRGKPVSDGVQEIGFRIGGVLLFTLMGIALFNDIVRLT